jgi:hypothetical protein
MPHEQKRRHLTPEQEDALKKPAEVAIIRPNQFDRLPDELVAMIVKWVGAYSHASLQEVDRRFRSIVTDRRRAYTLNLIDRGHFLGLNSDGEIQRFPYNPGDPDAGNPRIKASLVLTSPNMLAHYGSALLSDIQSLGSEVLAKLVKEAMETGAAVGTLMLRDGVGQHAGRYHIPRTEEGYLNINPMIAMKNGRADTIMKIFFPEPGDMLSLERPKKVDPIGDSPAETDYADHILRLAARERRLDVLKLIVNRGLGSLDSHVTNEFVMNALVDNVSAPNHEHEIAIITFIYEEWAFLVPVHRAYDWNDELIKAAAYVPDDVGMWMWFRAHGYNTTAAECVKPAVENTSDKIFAVLIKEMKATREDNIPNVFHIIFEAYSKSRIIGMALPLLDMDLTRMHVVWHLVMLLAASGIAGGVSNDIIDMDAILTKWNMRFPGQPFPWEAEYAPEPSVASQAIANDKVGNVRWLLAHGLPPGDLLALRSPHMSAEMNALFDTVAI